MPDHLDRYRARLDARLLLLALGDGALPAGARTFRSDALARSPGGW